MMATPSLTTPVGSAYRTRGRNLSKDDLMTLYRMGMTGTVKAHTSLIIKKVAAHTDLKDQQVVVGGDIS